jgi:phage terminase large subunit-like protein
LRVRRLRIGRKLSVVLTASNRYVILHGGRGSGKSWVVARRLILKGKASRRLILCVREVQKSLDDSVMKLLTDEIERLGLGWFYTVLSNEIRGQNGTRFIFAGVKTDPNKVKSVEGVTDVWVEEAENVSEESWRILLPSIGRTVKDPQIFITFNPYSDGDPTTIRFLQNPPTDSLVIECNWWDNPDFPDYLRELKDDDYARDPGGARHIWEGKTIEEAGTTEFDMTRLKPWEAERFDGINWYLLVDPSGSKKKENGDWTVMAAVGLGKDRNVYVARWVRDRLNLLEKYSTMVKLHEIFGFKAIGYEDSSGGLEIDYLTQKGGETGYRLPIIPLKATKAKEERIRWLVPLVQEYRLYLPEACMYDQLDGVRIDLTAAFKKEMSAFPHISAALHDDMLDATSRIMDPDLMAMYPTATAGVIQPRRQATRYDPATKKMVPI